jgi:hypothetical protein
VSDWLDAGHTKQELLALAKMAQEYPPRRWRPLDLVEAKLPPIEGFLNGALFARQTLGMICGRRGGGKTNLILKLLYALGTGSHFGPYSTRAAKVLFLSQEMTDVQIRERLYKMFSRSELVQINDSVTIICRDEVRLDSDEGADRLAALVDSVKPDVFLIDALCDVKGGVKENDNDDMGEMGRRIIGRVCIPLDCAGIISHHTGRPKEDGSPAHSRGGIALEDAVSDIMFLDWPKGKPYRTGSFQPPAGKVRHAVAPPPFAFTIAESEEGRLEVDILSNVELVGDHDALVMKVKELLKKEGSMSLENIAERIGTGKAIARETLKSAAALGFAVKAGSGGLTVWGPNWGPDA